MASPAIPGQRGWLAERCVEVVEQRGASPHSFVVFSCGVDDAIDEQADASGLGPAEPILFQIDVMDDLGNRGERGVSAQIELRQQRFERALVALMREVAADHVEPDLPGTTRLARRVNESKARRGIDEAPDEP